MDDPLRLKARSLAMKNPVSTVAAASSAITDNLFRIPRLVLMVRQLVAGQDDSQHTVDTLTLAKSIFDAPSKIMIENLINNSSVTSNSTASPLGSYIEYSDDDVYAVAVFYYIWRNVIYGIVQRVLDRVEPALSMHYFNRDRVETEDVEAAEKNAMSIDFAFRQTLTPPFNAMRICTPLKISYGTWNKLQKRHETGNTTILKHATNMKGVVCESYNRAMSLWQIQLSTQERAEQMCEAYSGGKIMPLLSRKR